MAQHMGPQFILPIHHSTFRLSREPANEVTIVDTNEDVLRDLYLPVASAMAKRSGAFMDVLLGPVRRSTVRACPGAPEASSCNAPCVALA